MLNKAESEENFSVSSCIFIAVLKMSSYVDTSTFYKRFPSFVKCSWLFSNIFVLLEVQCTTSYCKNGGTCTKGSKGISCKCAHGYLGENCETSK